MEADYGVTEMAFNQGNRTHGDSMLLVRFYKHSRKSLTETQENGFPKFVETDYIEIMQPGNKDSIIRRPATERDKQRFPEHFRKYEARMDQNEVEGTPLEEWPAITRSQVEELRFLNIRSVEQLAGIADSNAQKIMGIQMLKQKAKDFLDGNSATERKLKDLEEKYEALLAAKEDAPRRTRRTKAEIEADEATEE